MNKFNDDNQRHGFWEKYFSNNNLSYRGNFINGLKDGYWEDYFPDGIPYYKGKFVKDERIGYWVWYYHTGDLIEKEFYL